MHNHETATDILIVRPRFYERKTALMFLGRRRRTYDRMVQLAGISAGDHVLDIGCGPGFLTRRAAVATGPTGRVVGIDPSEPVIEYARRKSPPWCEYQITGGDRIDGPDGGFDVAVTSLAMHHVPADRRSATLAEIHRLVRPGGRLLIVEFRPPRSRLGRRVVGTFVSHGMRHNHIEHIPHALSEAGFTPTATGDLWPLLSYVVAQRP